MCYLQLTIKIESKLMLKIATKKIYILISSIAKNHFALYSQIISQIMLKSYEKCAKETAAPRRSRFVRDIFIVHKKHLQHTLIARSGNFLCFIGSNADTFWLNWASLPRDRKNLKNHWLICKVVNFCLIPSSWHNSFGYRHHINIKNQDILPLAFRRLKD